MGRKALVFLPSLLILRPINVRARAASMAQAVGTSMPVILNMAFWRREDLIINCF